MGGTTNSEIVRSAYEAMNRRDMRTFLALIDREVEWRGPERGTDPDTYVGAAGVDRFFGTRLEVWGELVQEPTELREAGDTVLALVAVRARGRASGIEIEERAAHLWELRDGKVIRFGAFDDEAAALAAADLRADG